MTTAEILVSAKAASKKLAVLSGDERNSMLLAIADALLKRSDEILLANASDVENARGKLTKLREAQR